MIIGKNYTITFLQDNKETWISNDFFLEFKVFEDFNYGMYFAELTLKSNMFWDLLLVTTEQLTAKISVSNNENDLKEYSVDFYIFDYKMYSDSVIITLVPKLYDKLVRTKHTASYEDTLDRVIRSVASKAGIEKIDTTPVNVEKKIFIQDGVGYFHFLREIAERYAKNYYLFLDKTGKLWFNSYDALTARKKKYDEVSKISATDFRVENNTMSMLMTGGSGATGYYFDWESGKIKNYGYQPDKFGAAKSFVDKKNQLVMLPPIGKNVHASETYNKNEIEGMVQRKNVFKTMMSFDTITNMFDFTAGDTVKLTMPYSVDISKTNDAVSGTWVIYSIIHHFTNWQVGSHVTVGLPFFNTKSTYFLT